MLYFPNFYASFIMTYYRAPGERMKSYITALASVADKTFSPNAIRRARAIAQVIGRGTAAGCFSACFI